MPASSGMTLATAWAAPVEVGMMLQAAARARRGSLWAMSRMRWLSGRREEGARKETAPADMVYEERAKQILRYIQSHYQEDISIEDMARQVHISRTECFRCFQRITGKSPKNYLNSYRIRQAMRRLETTQDSVTDICFSCGFNHMSYFVKRFRESVGMSPGKYRDMMRGREDLPATEAEKGEQHA